MTERRAVDRTRIEWADATWNPVMGCTPVSEGCANCYARAMMQRYAGQEGWAQAPDVVTTFPDRLGQPLRWRKPRRVFVCSMSDLFHERVPFDFIGAVFDAMTACPASPLHSFDTAGCRQDSTFYVLTKRPARGVEWLTWTDECWPGDSNFGWAREAANGWPANIWLGVSAENQERADERVPLLVNDLPARRFVSVEPMLGPVDLSRWLPGLGWVICGAETGPHRRPFDAQWARDLRDQCVAAGVPFFFKQGSALHPGQSDLLDGQEWKQVPATGGVLA